MTARASAEHRTEHFSAKPRRVRTPLKNLRFRPTAILPNSETRRAASLVLVCSRAETPVPTRPGIFQKYDAQGVRPTDTNQFTIKTDYVLTSKQRLSVSYSRRDTERIAGATVILPLPFTNQDVFQQDFKSNIARIQYDYNLTATLLNHLNIGYTYFDVANANTTDPFDTSTLGLPVNATQNSAFPRIGFPGYGADDPRNVQTTSAFRFWLSVNSATAFAPDERFNIPLTCSANCLLDQSRPSAISDIAPVDIIQIMTRTKYCTTMICLIKHFGLRTRFFRSNAPKRLNPNAPKRFISSAESRPD